MWKGNTQHNNAEEAEGLLRGGVEVKIKAPVKKGRNFYYFSVSPSRIPSSLPPWLMIIFITYTVVTSLMGGFGLRYIGAHVINIYLQYPSTNCTIESYDLHTGCNGNAFFNYVSECSQGQNYNVNVSLVESGDLLFKNIMVSKVSFEDKHWENGTVFKCSYHGSWLADYSDIINSMDSLISLWFLGFVIPLGFLFTGVLIWFSYFIIKSKFTTAEDTYNYPSTLSYLNDSVFMPDASSVVPQARQYAYLGLKAIYSREFPRVSSVNIRKMPKKSNIVIMIIFVVIIPLATSAGLFFFGIYNFINTYEFAEFCISILLLSIAVPLLLFIIFIIKWMAARNSYCYETGEIEFGFSIYTDHISGYYKRKEENSSL